MMNNTNSDLHQNVRRRSADNTPSSRVADYLNNAPTSPKIHELREQYISRFKPNRETPLHGLENN